MSLPLKFDVDAVGDLQILWEDPERALCRGRRRDAGGGFASVLIVFPAADHPPPAVLDRLAHEYGLKDELDPAWAARPLDLVREGGRTALLLEDPGGEPLERLLGAPMETGRFLRLAIDIAAALGKAHQRGLVHKDVKPANILVDCPDGQARLTGFGLASRLPRECQAPEPPEVIAGTLAYMAPEQTGRMNRSIDSRSDLYALGVTFYRMLTGALPFTASDPMEWVHCHIARLPLAPSERAETVPATVSRIVMKLLAKTAEERYQTAAGVERDLKRCLAAWEAERRIDDFPLGEHDTPDRLLIPEKLYGRAREIETLLASFDRIIKSGAPELVLVSGYSGIGKSSVVKELHKALVPPRALFASGKFDQLKRDIPYSTLVQAFQSLVRPLLGESDTELTIWCDAFLGALGPNGRLITDLVPELKLIIGEQPPVPELEPQQAQGRFQLVFRRFISVFARPEHPLALFLDDLQWLDTATLDLLEDLLIRSDLQYLLLIGAYRNNEVDAAHPLAHKLQAIKNAGGKIEAITLAPLTRDDLGQLIADALRCEPQRAAPLAQLVHEKTGGNPFFAIQFLSGLAEEGLLRFDHDRARWSWDLERIHDKGYTGNVVDLMVGKLNGLPIETQRVLQRFACLGNVAAVATLSMVLGTPEEPVHAALWPAVRRELVERLGGRYRFIHDRVQEAAYSLIPEISRAEAHLRIGRLLVAQTVPQERKEAIFDIVNQLNRGAALITRQEERDQLAELNLIAGKRAKASTAYASALAYLNAGAALSDEDCWERQHEQIFALELNRAECEFLTGGFGVAEKRLLGLSLRARTLVDKAAVARLRIVLYTAMDRSDRAVGICLDYLREVGIEWRPHPTDEEVREEYERMCGQLGSRPIEALFESPLLSDIDERATMEVLTEVISAATLTDPNLSGMVLLRMANLSIEHGNSDGSCYAYAFLNVVGSRFGNYRVGYRWAQLALDLVDKKGLDRFKARVYLASGMVAVPWSRHFRAGVALIRRALETAFEIGDLTYTGYCYQNLAKTRLLGGDRLADVQREAEEGLKFTKQARLGLSASMITGHLRFIRTLRGLTPTFGLFRDDEFDDVRFEQGLEGNPRLTLAACVYWIRKLQVHVYSGSFGQALKAAAKVQPLLWAAALFFDPAEYHYYGALAKAAAFDFATPDERREHAQALDEHHKRLVVWAENCPENFEDRAALVGAEIARLEGNDADAMRLYERAIRSARDNGLIHNEALANEVASRFYAARGFDQIADLYLRNARYCYLRWGADGKVRQLEETYPRLRAEEPPSGPTSTIATPVERLDLATVIRVSQAVSGEIVLEKLIDTLMRTAIEQAGAERGLLILSREAEPRIEAEATTGGDTVSVQLHDEPVTASVLPETLLHYVLRTRESVILDDAATQSPFADDPYIRERAARSILCLPLINQTKLIGVLYLENNLAPRAFAPTRIAVLKLLASQAAISLENTRLYRDLEQREAKIRRLVDANIVGIFMWNFEGQILEANDAFLRMVGYDREDLVAGRLHRTDLTPPEWRDPTAHALVELKMTGTIQPNEKEYFRKDGNRVPVLLGAASFDETANQGVTFVLDLTERKRAEAALRRSEAYLAQSESLSKSGSWAWKPATKEIIYWSQERSRLFGFDPAAGVPSLEAVLDRIHPEDRAAWLATVSGAARDGNTDVEFRVVLPNGEIRRLQGAGHAVFTQTGHLIEIVSAALDVTERRRAEDALRDSEEQWKAVFENNPTMYFMLDATYTILSVNPFGAEQLGYAPEELTGQPVGILIHEADRERALRNKAACLEHLGRTMSWELRKVRKDRSIIWVRETGRAMWIKNRPVVLVVSEDITEAKRAADALREMQIELAHANRLETMGQLTASIAHEVNQPIAATLTNAQAALRWLDRPEPDLDEARHALGRIVRDGTRAGAVVQRIRNLTKKAPRPEDRVEINAAIREVIDFSSSEAMKNSVSVRTELAEGLPPVRGDRVELQQVVLNLMLNAVEAMSGMSDGPRQLLVATDKTETGDVLVAVRDSGPGLPPAIRENLFKAFHTTKPKGLGLGLSICRSIVESYGGRLWASANAPRGAVFQFTLPSNLDDASPG